MDLGVINIIKNAIRMATSDEACIFADDLTAFGWGFLFFLLVATRPLAGGGNFWLNPRSAILVWFMDVVTLRWEFFFFPNSLRKYCLKNFVSFRTRQAANLLAILYHEMASSGDGWWTFLAGWLLQRKTYMRDDHKSSNSYDKSIAYLMGDSWSRAISCCSTSEQIKLSSNNLQSGCLLVESEIAVAIFDDGESEKYRSKKENKSDTRCIVVLIHY